MLALNRDEVRALIECELYPDESGQLPLHKSTREQCDAWFHQVAGERMPISIGMVLTTMVKLPFTTRVEVQSIKIGMLLDKYKDV